MAINDSEGARKRFGPGRNALRGAQQSRGHRLHNIWRQYSARQGHDVVLKSDAEFEHFCWLEGDPKIKSYELEPAPIIVHIDNEPHKTQFDALCYMRTGQPQLREVSESDSDLDERKLLQREVQLEAVRRSGYDYVRITRIDLDQHRMLISNWRRALAFLAACRNLVLEPLCAEVLATIKRERRCDLETLLLTTDPSARPKYIAAVFRCLQDGRLQSDLDLKALCGASIFWLPESVHG